jgi:hypothetical protein
MSEKTYLSSLSYEQQLLICAGRLSFVDFENINYLLDKNINWKQFAKLGAETTLAPLLFKNLSNEKISKKVPTQILQYFKKYYQKVLLDNMKLYDDFNKVAALLISNNTEFIPLKGVFLAETVYKDIALRQMCDMDILVNSSDIEKVKNLLIENNWTSHKAIQNSKFIEKQYPYYCPYKFIKGNSVLELHRHLHKSTYTFKLEIDNFWKRAKKINFLGKEINVFSPTDFLQHLAVHLHIHFYKGSFKLASFADIHEFVIQYKTEIDWELLKSTNKNQNCEEEVSTILHLCKVYFQTEIPDEFFTGKEFIDENSEILFKLLLDNDLEKANIYLKDYNINDSKNIKGSINKFRYLIANVFPSLAYMENKHNTKNKISLSGFYFLRIFESLEKFKSFIKKK